MVAPRLARSMSRTMAFFENSRGGLALAAFFTALAGLLALAFAVATLAPFRAPFGVLGAFAEAAASGAARFWPLGPALLAVGFLVEVAPFGAIGGDSGPRRMGFRGEAEHRSGLIPHAIPG